MIIFVVLTNVRRVEDEKNNNKNKIPNKLVKKKKKLNARSISTVIVLLKSVTEIKILIC